MRAKGAHRLNCWEIRPCGREPGGRNIDHLGVCPAATAVSADGLNHGANGGRICWDIAGTLCEGQVRGTFARKIESCMQCVVFKRVRDEEGVVFRTRTPEHEKRRQRK